MTIDELIKILEDYEIFVDDDFGVFSIAEIIKLYELCNSETQKSLLNYLE